jgi:tetratricopeptide (TPR) repeat protein
MMNTPLSSIEIPTKVGKITPLEPLDSFPPSEKHPLILKEKSLVNGRYRIEEVLGEGGMGIVYHVTDLLNPERPVALKNISGLGKEAIELDLFKAEFRLMTELHHPNVAAVYDFEALAGTEDYFFTMELVSGTNILEATEGASWQKVVDLLVPLCRALSYVHSRGIIHFDIKPANVLVNKSGVPKILDFGIAGLRKFSSEKIVAGTVNYMAPELQMSGAMIDHRVDLYSLGILAYQLLCRSLPFDGSTFSEVLEQHQRAPIVWSESAQTKLPGWLRAIVERLCAKNPADRFRTANNVIEAINQQKGFSYELETQKTRESYIFSSRFVGREVEFETITRFIRARIEGKTRATPILFVAGQSGVGKSRLLREVRFHSQLARLPFIEGNCYEARFSEYGAIDELLTYLVPLVEAAGRSDLIEQYGAELSKIEPEIALKYHFESSPPLAKPEAEHLRLREQVCEFFVRVAEVIPYTFYINDLQWAPSGTADLLFHLAWQIILRERLGKSCPISLLGSYRDEEVEGRPLEKLLTRLREEGGRQVIELKPLVAESINPLLCSMLGIDTLPPLFVDRVIRETAGNPYFVEEVMRTLVENGSVYIENGLWAATTEIRKLEIPASISSVFLRRASLLSWEQHLIVDLLAVGDRPTPLEVIAKVVPLTGETLQAILSTLERKQMVRISSDGRELQLSHDRMRETLYGAIEKNVQLDLHHKLGEALEQIFNNNLTPHLGALAYHFARAQDHDKALHYSITAGDDARDRYANDFAISMYEQALMLLDPSHEKRREIRESLANVYWMGGRYDDALTLFKQLLSEATTNEEKARLHRRIGGILFDRANIVGALDEQWHALELMGERRPRSRLAMGMALLRALLVHFVHRYFPGLIRRATSAEERAMYVERCGVYGKLTETYWFCDPLGMLLAIFRSMNFGEHAGDSKELCFIYAGMLPSFGVMTFFQTAERFGLKAAQMAERLHSTWHRGLVFSYRGMLALFRGQWVRALEEFHEGRILLDKCGDYFEASVPYWMSFYASLYLGQLEQARKWVEEGITICQRTQVKGLGYFLAQHALVNAYLGQQKGTSEEAEKAMKVVEKDSPDVFSLCLTEIAVGECLLIVGNIDGAIVHLEHVKTVREEKKLMHYWFVGVYPLLVHARLEKFRRDHQVPSQTELRNLSKLARTGVHLTRRRPNVIVPCLIASARVAWAEGAKKKARHFFTEAIRYAEKQGAMLYLGQAHYEAGRAYLAGEADDRAHAKEHLLAAYDAFKVCGAAPFLEATQTLLNSLTYQEVQTGS